MGWRGGQGAVGRRDGERGYDADSLYPISYIRNQHIGYRIQQFRCRKYILYPISWIRIQDIGYKIQDIGYRIQDIGKDGVVFSYILYPISCLWIQDVGYRKSSPVFGRGCGIQEFYILYPRTKLKIQDIGHAFPFLYPISYILYPDWRKAQAHAHYQNMSFRFYCSSNTVT